MSDYTEHYNLKKPKQTESYNVEDANSNNDIIDKTLFKKQDKIPGKGLSTNDFTNEYKNKIDNLQRIYRFKGNVENYAGLSEISASNGDIYNVINEAKNYAWNGTEWVQLGFVIDMSEFAYKEEIPTKNSQLENDSNFASFPSGGYKGQILEKKSNNDNDVEWVYNDGGITGDTLPIGSVVEFASDNIPDNWLLCNGQAVSRTDYAELFAAIGTTWGTGDGSTTFNVPTKEGLVTVGKKTSDSDFNTLGKTGGVKTQEHDLNTASAVASIALNTNGNIDYGETQSTENIAKTYTVATGGSGTNKSVSNKWGAKLYGKTSSESNLQPYTTSNFIIKAKQSSGVVATVVDNLNSTSATNALSAKQGKILNDKISTTYVNTGGAVDLNDYTEQGWYFFTSNNTIANVPAGVNGWLKVVKDKDSGTWTKQIWYRAGTPNSNDYRTYVRTRTGDIWSNWKQYQMVEDSGWQTLALTSDFHTYADSSPNTPMYRKVGKVVEIVGAIAPTSNISADTNKIIATLPEGYRPSKNRYFVCQGTGRAIWTLHVYPDGQVIFSRYGKSDYTDVSTNVWLPFNVMFLVD